MSAHRQVDGSCFSCCVSDVHVLTNPYLRKRLCARARSVIRETNNRWHFTKRNRGQRRENSRYAPDRNKEKTQIARARMRTSTDTRLPRNISQSSNVHSLPSRPTQHARRQRFTLERTLSPRSFYSIFGHQFLRQTVSQTRTPDLTWNAGRSGNGV